MVLIFLIVAAACSENVPPLTSESESEDSDVGRLQGDYTVKTHVSAPLLMLVEYLNVGGGCTKLHGCASQVKIMLVVC